uniref:Uncharacterized protein n=1 Tax=Meloidogyne enterolobii TaxID=390850 RepID=A0A6V7UKI4_MELEN|nr:unnamed protein product [Meloidogyne enterolobii]
MEIEFKNPLNVPIVFRFRIALFLCIWKKSSTVKFSLLRHIVTNARTALIDKEDKGDLSGKILNNINLYTNYKKLNAKSQQVNELTELGLMENIEELLRQLVPISKENELPWEEAKDKVFELMRIIKDLEYGERKFSTKVTKKIGSVLVKIILLIEINEIDRKFSNNLRNEMSLEEYYKNININFEAYYKNICNNLEGFMSRLRFSEFTLLNQPIKIDLEAIRNKTEEYLKFGCLSTELRMILFFYFLISHYVDLLDMGGEKRIKYFESINLGHSSISSGFTYNYTADWLQNALMIPIEKEIHNYVRLHNITENHHDITNIRGKEGLRYRLAPRGKVGLPKRYLTYKVPHIKALFFSSRNYLKINFKCL